jgi:hypothetical protein
MKCGTVSLHQYLALHPETCMSSIDEVDFFVEELVNGLTWHQNHFRLCSSHRERSTNYTKYPTFQGVPARMHTLIPMQAIYNGATQLNV